LTHNKKVLKIRELLKKVIRITCFFGLQEIAFCGHDKTETLDNLGNYIDLTYFLTEFDEQLLTQLDSSTINNI